jgi:hypothetical protein
MFSTDGRSISAPFEAGPGRTGIALLDAESGEQRAVAWWPFPVAFRASWADGDGALIVSRVEVTSHVVLFDRLSSP